MRLALVLIVLAVIPSASFAAAPMNALIIDGQNNHSVWPQTTYMMKKYLEDTGLFRVDIARTAYTWGGGDLPGRYPAPGITTKSVEQPTTDPDFRPEFRKYDVVVSNYNGAAWPRETQSAFVDFVRNGGGVVIVHAANNAFVDWSEYNEIIGLGGWNGRDEKSGPYVYFDESGRLVRDDKPGPGGHHGAQHEFSVVVRDRRHPVTKGMPVEWMHTQDELYDLLRGPAANMQVLATAWASREHGGSGRHEPMIFSVVYGKGRILHTPMGHGDYSQECVGFITTIQRGAEWAVTGKVTQPIPDDFPTADRTSVRKWSGS